MAVRYVTVNRTYLDATGTAITGITPTFQLLAQSVNGTTTIVDQAVVCTVNASGQLIGPHGGTGVLLAANDTLVTSGTYYQVSGEPNTPPYNIIVTSLWSTIDLAQIVALNPPVPVPGVFVVLPSIVAGGSSSSVGAKQRQLVDGGTSASIFPNRTVLFGGRS